MGDGMPGVGLFSTISRSGELLLRIEAIETKEPQPDEIVVAVEAAPINPSDLILLLGPADLETLEFDGTADRPTARASVRADRLPGLSTRLDQAMPTGNEGAGRVVRAGANMQALLGKLVTMRGGATYATHRTLAPNLYDVLPDGVSAAQGASSFVNPMTSLAMVEAMRLEGHKALVHTAAASNLGQMLNKLCLAEGVPLVNIVRNEAQAALLRAIGATHIVDSSAASFKTDLTDALADTGATLAFDAIGGGRLANTILEAMEAAANRQQAGYSRYGSATHKQVYVYGGLDTRPTEITRSVGMAWGVGGFLLTNFLQRIGGEGYARLRARALGELTTLFASHYSATISLADMLKPEVIAAYARRATGEKFLVDPRLPC